MLPASHLWPPSQVLAELVRNARANDPIAVEVLLTAIRPALLVFFRQRSDPDHAEDLAQLALLRISRAIDRIDPVRADLYLSTVARNLLRTNYRSAARDRRRSAPLADAAEMPNESNPTGNAELEDLMLAVHRACLNIGQPALRDVALGVLGGESTSELAHRLEISPITVRTRLMRVRALLRQQLPAYFEDLSASL